MKQDSPIDTDHKVKVMSSHACDRLVILSTGVDPWIQLDGVCGWGCVWTGVCTLSPEITTDAVGTHPTGMHSCYCCDYTVYFLIHVMKVIYAHLRVCYKPILLLATPKIIPCTWEVS